MIYPDLNQGGEHVTEFPVSNPDNYWRLHGRLNNVFEILGVRVHGQEHVTALIDQSEGVILTPTHTSWLDVVSLTAIDKGTHPMRFLGKKEIWRIPIVRNIAQDAGAVKVHRGETASQQKALQTSVMLLNAGEWLVNYPEATRNRSKDRSSIAEKIKTGAARAALQAEGVTPIVPIGIGFRGNMLFRRASPHHVGIVIGEPIFVPHQQGDKDEITQAIHGSLTVLKAQAVELAHERR